MTPQRKASASVGLALILIASGYAALRSEPAGSGAGQTHALNGQSGGARRLVAAGLGVVEPSAGTVELATLMPGVLASVRVREGDSVRRGDIVAEIVNDDLKARVAQAEATLAIKTAQMKLVEAGPRAEEIRKAEAQLREEEGNMTLLQAQFDRRQRLVREGAVSSEALNAAGNSLTAAKERRSAAQSSLAILRQGSRPEEIKAARAEVSLAENQLAEARAALAKSYVRASTDGIVLRRNREPGEAISTQTVMPVVQIADISRLSVRTQIDENDIAALRIGQSARITAPALDGRTLIGRVERISPRLGAKTISSDSPTEKRDARVLDVMVALPPDARLPINLRVDVVIDLASGDVPVAGLRGPLGGAHVTAPARRTARAAPDAVAGSAVAVAEPVLAGSRFRQSLLSD
ncbi:MAG: HlyD family secretion protein [Bosea sp. (in: a-proteobacteria)]